MNESVRAGAPEIEVTPKMVEAGLRALAGYDPTQWSDDETAAILKGVYVAMERRRRADSPKAAVE